MATISKQLAASRSLLLCINNQTELALEQCHHHFGWQPLFQLASSHLLTSLVAHRLSSYREQLPDETQEFCDAVLLLNEKRNQEIRKTTRQITNKLNQAKIEPLLLKGAAINAMAETYKEADILRMQSDIDLLVTPDAIDAAVEVLLAEGWQFGVEAKNDEGDLQLVPASQSQLKQLQRRYKYHHHLPALIREDAPCSIELHRRCSSTRFQEQLPSEQLYKEATKIRAGNATARVLAPAMQFKHWLYHDYIGGGFEAGYRIPYRLLADWNMLGQPLFDDPLATHFNALARQLFTLNRHSEFEGAVKQLVTQKQPSLQQLQHCYQLLLQMPGRQTVAKLRKTINHAKNAWHNPGKIWQRL